MDENAWGETIMEFLLTSSYTAVDPKTFQLKIILEDDLIDEAGRCYFPVRPLPKRAKNAFKDLPSNMYLLGQTLLRKYYVVLDNRPVESAPPSYKHVTQNNIGIAHCKDHKAKIAYDGTNKDDQPPLVLIIPLSVAGALLLCLGGFCCYRKKKYDEQNNPWKNIKPQAYEK